ncbi:cation diffusion facilitator family transporter [Allomyces macrogynus ATCC 38327]|uniref:Cation diffusion facilitator family transporter n=1 Tax=Allomyces macrogynus (strain ATCC 38327) TaxID=578462 RepID=A0A0L0S0B7_ALLM3|nr:cation diffusion facilitator family transporter [Allomyces macrogynus ATCC 38327]|eukprot:KNE56067.1 cation diffusion facilitator family transporter [Allomyces macrogynus ATCC 38327]
MMMYHRCLARLLHAHGERETFVRAMLSAGTALRSGRDVASWSTVPRRHHGSHSHHDQIKDGSGDMYPHHHDLRDALETAEGARITWIGIWTNVVLSAAKFVGGFAYNSPSLLADAGHNVSDLASDFVTLWAIRRGRRAPSPEFPWGHGRAETLGTFTVSGMLLGGAALFAFHSGGQLAELIPTTNTAVHLPGWMPHHHHHVSGIPLDGWALALAAAGWSVKEALYLATAHLGKKLNSQVLMSNAWHHRSDAWGSAVALAGIGGAMAGFPVADPIGGIIVSTMIARVGWHMAVSSARDLCDASVVRNVIVVRTTSHVDGLRADYSPRLIVGRDRARIIEAGGA